MAAKVFSVPLNSVDDAENDPQDAVVPPVPSSILRVTDENAPLSPVRVPYSLTVGVAVPP